MSGLSPELTIILTAVLTAASCALAGSFLVLRRMAMMADAISHAILPGLVFSFVLANGPNLFAGIFGASLAGIATVVLVEALQRTGLVKSDAAIGIVFPAMFAFGTLLVTRFFSDVHLDADAILFGEVSFAPFDRLIINGIDYGSYPLIVVTLMTVVNLVAIVAFYKELKLATFDAGLAAALGFSPIVIHYGLMTLVSMTTVSAFSAVGAILVVALMIVPAGTAYLLTDRLPVMIVLSVVIGTLAALIGYQTALAFNVSISGMMVVALGVLFGLAALFSPTQGVLVRKLRRRQQRVAFATDLLVAHLHHHPQFVEDRGSLVEELNWSESHFANVIRSATRRDLITLDDDQLQLTDTGHMHALAHGRSLRA